MSGFGLFLGNHIRRGLAYRWVVLVPAVLVFALVTIFITLQPDTYEAHAILMKPLASEPDLESRRDAAQMAADAFRSASERLLGNTMLTEIVHRVDPYPELMETLGAEACVEELRRNLRIDVNRGARTITVTCQHNMGDDAAKTAVDLVNVLTKEFMKTQESAIRDRLQGHTTFLEDEKKDRRKELEREQSALDEFKRLYANSLPSDVDSNQAQIDRLQRDIFDYRARMRAYDNTLSAMGRELKRYDVDIRMMTDRGVEAVIARGLQAAEGRLADLEEALDRAKFDYADDHEIVLGIENQIKSLKARIEEMKKNADTSPIEEQKKWIQFMVGETKKARKRTDEEIELLKDRISKTEASITAADARIKKAGEIEGRYTSLQRNVAERLLAYNQVLERYQDAELRNNRQDRDVSVPIHIHQRGFAPAKPAGPDRLMTSFMGLLVGLGVGVALAVARHKLDTSFHRPDDLRALLPGAVLVTVPDVRSGGTRVGVMVVSILGGLVLAGVFAATIGLLGMQVGWWGDPDMIRNLLMK